MSDQIHIAHKFGKVDDKTIVIDTTSGGGKWRGLSPFIIGPCQLYDEHVALNMENAWQFAKVYPEHVNSKTKEPSNTYWTWAKAGWADSFAHRYPMGKGRVPLYSYWKGKQLNYIQARQKIYFPLYAKAVRKTESFAALRRLVKKGKTITLRDWDGYDHEELGDSLTDVLKNPKRKMGHAFVLKAILLNDPVCFLCGIS